MTTTTTLGWVSRTSPPTHTHTSQHTYSFPYIKKAHNFLQLPCNVCARVFCALLRWFRCVCYRMHVICVTPPLIRCLCLYQNFKKKFKGHQRWRSLLVSPLYKEQKRLSRLLSCMFKKFHWAMEQNFSEIPYCSNLKFTYNLAERLYKLPEKPKCYTALLAPMTGKKCTSHLPKGLFI